MKDHKRIDNIVNRIVKKARVPDILDVLVNRISGSDLQSLLISVYNRRVSTCKPRDVLVQYMANRFVKAAIESPVDAARFDSIAFSLLPKGYEAVELSPVCPLGTSSVMGPVDQNNVLSTIRNTEVCSDSTNALALECAFRRMSKKRVESESEIKLCASHRLVRTQQFEGSASFPHFRVLSLCSTGRDKGNFDFEAGSAIEHVEYYIRVLEAVREIGFNANGIRVKLIPLTESMTKTVKDRIARELSNQHPNVIFEIEPGIGNHGEYYHSLRFNLFATSDNGNEYFLADGGFTAWMEKLLNNRKERLMTSGMGTERFLACFKNTSAGG